MAWALIISNFNVSRSIDTWWISLWRSCMNFTQLAGRAESRFPASRSGALSLASTVSSSEYSTSDDRKFRVVGGFAAVVVVVVVAVVTVDAAAAVAVAAVVADELWSWVARLELLEALQLLELASLCRLRLYMSNGDAARSPFTGKVKVCFVHFAGSASNLSSRLTTHGRW